MPTEMTFTVYMIADPIANALLITASGIIVFKIVYKLIELIPGM